MPSVVTRAVNLVNTYVGTVYAKKQGLRSKYSHRLSETPSCRDRINSAFVVAQTKAEQPSAVELIEHYRSMIEEHIERRVAIYFQQLVVCYRTFLHFEIGDTRHQGESGTTLGVKIEGETSIKKLSGRDAAHSSTIPCLVAYSKAEWEEFQKNGGPRPRGFTYIEGADIYRGANATLEMPRDINEADIEIDGKKESSELRTHAIGLLNKAAVGEETPVTGISRFLDHIIAAVHQKRGTAGKESVRYCLAFYEEYLLDIRNRVNTDPTIFDQLLGVQVGGSPEEIRLRKLIYDMRYQAIRSSQYEQSALCQKINAVRDSVFKSIGLKTVPYFDDAYRLVLMENMLTEQDAHRVAKLLNSPQRAYFTILAGETDQQVLRATQQRAAKLEKTKQLICNKCQQKIRDLAQELREKFRDLKRVEILLRGDAVRTVRREKNWTQTVLANRIKALFPAAIASQSTVSRVENHQKLVSSSYAEQLSAVFQVPPVLFMPTFFYE